MKCQVLIDWLTFSVKEKDPRYVIQTYLGMDPDLFQDTGYSQFMGYSKVLRFSDIFVCSEGREDNNFHNMGVCVSMSGNGCRTFETMSKLSLGTQNKQGTKSVAFPALFQLLASDADSNVSRIDIACDDREGCLSMDQIIAKTWANEINSRMKRRDVHFSLEGTQQAGATVYIGAASSDFRVRIYDKALEQGVEGHYAWQELQVLCGPYGPRPCKKVVICYVPGRRPVQRYPVRHSDPAGAGPLRRYGSAPDCRGDILLDYPPQQEAVTQPYPSDLLAAALVCVTKL